MVFVLRRIVIAVLLPFLWRQWRERRRRRAAASVQPAG
jgi:hypothetical protein